MFSTTTANFDIQSKKKIIAAIILFSIAYLCFQLFYIPYSEFTADELWFARHIYQYTNGLPYRDFPPYKTVIGYYLLTLPYYLSHQVLTPYFLIKDEIALINTLVLGCSSIWLTKFFNPKAVLWALLLIMFNQLFLLYSVDLRVDMLTGWMGLLSILLILHNRIKLSGIAIALSFLISQKALWYIIAMNVALGTCWIFALRDWRVVRQILIFNLSMLVTIAIYISCWAFFSSYKEVINSVFNEAFVQSKINWYANIRLISWQTILSNGPLLFILWPLTWVSLFINPVDDKNRIRRIFILTYSSVMTLFIITYKQPFPYNLVFIAPVFLLLFADFFSWLENFSNKTTSFKTQILSLTKRQLFWFFSFYMIAIIAVVIIFALSRAYLITLLIPLFLYQIIQHSKSITPEKFDNKWLANFIMLTVFFTGILYPLERFILIAYILDGKYQQSMMKLAHGLLNEGEGYIAGTPLLYDRDQPIPGLKNLIGPAIEYLYKPTEAIKPILLESLYMTPISVNELLKSFQTHPVKLLVATNRVLDLPPQILKYLYSEYLHFWGSVYLYAPTIKQSDHAFVIQFDGKYSLMSQNPKAEIFIDKHLVKINTVMQLAKGIHYSKATGQYRLSLIPQTTDLVLNPAEKNNAWWDMIKPIGL